MRATRLPASAREHDRVRDAIDCALESRDTCVFRRRGGEADAPDPLLACTMSYGDLEAREARFTLRVVLAALSDRLSPAEAQDLAAQLAEPWKDVVWKRRADGVQKMDREQFVERICRDLDVSIEEGVLRTRAVVAALEDRVSRGEMHQVLRQLPEEIREVVEPC